MKPETKSCHLTFYVRLSFVSALLFLASSCVSLERETPQKRRFAIQIEQTKPLSGKTTSAEIAKQGSLLIRRMQITPSFSGRNLVYKVSENEFETDYYNEFLVAPQVNIRAVVSRYLEGSEGFARVIPPSSRLRPDFLLESNIYILYGDFSSEEPRAVMEIKFVLIDARTQGVLLEKVYRKQARIPEKSASALVGGYRRCLLQILNELQKDIAQAKAQMGHERRPK